MLFRLCGFVRLCGLLLALSIVIPPGTADAAGNSRGGGGGGGGGVVTAKVTGYLTAIDYVNNRIVVGASYYGTGNVRIDSNTKIQINAGSSTATINDLLLNDWAEVKYDPLTRIATKIAITRP